MRLRYAEDLARDYGFVCSDEYYQYIVDSYENGNRDQCIELFSAMKGESKRYFLTCFLSPYDVLMDRRVLNLCIGFLCR